MEPTCENVTAIVKELNEKHPGKGATKHEIALYFDTEEDKLKRLKIEEEYKFAYDDTMTNYDNWLKRLNFKNSAEYNLDAIMPVLDASGEVRLIDTPNEYGQVNGRKYFYKEYIPNEYL